MHSNISKHLLIVPTKCTKFILYIYLLYFSYMFRCQVHYHHQGELLLHLLQIKYSYQAHTDRRATYSSPKPTIHVGTRHGLI